MRESVHYKIGQRSMSYSPGEAVLSKGSIKLRDNRGETLLESPLADIQGVNRIRHNMAIKIGGKTYFLAFYDQKKRIIGKGMFFFGSADIARASAFAEELGRHKVPVNNKQLGGRASTVSAVSKESLVQENVGNGLLFAALAIPFGILLSMAIYRIGFIASLSTFALAVSAMWLYQKGAGATPGKGAIGLIALIVVGIVASFFAMVGMDLSSVYDYALLHPDEFGSVTVAKSSFVMNNIFNTEMLKEYAGQIAMYIAFAALGSFQTLHVLAFQHQQKKKI